MQSDWTSSLQDILNACWASDPLKRPEAKDVHKMLRKEIHDMVERDFPARKTDERRKMG
jgi:hypothetical protein